MKVVIFQGDSYELEFEAKYNGEVLNPSQESQLRNCEVVLYSRMDKRKVLAKYALRKEYSIGVGWGTLGVDGTSLVLHVSSSETITDIADEIMMQVTNYIPDNNIPLTGLAIDTEVIPLFLIKSRTIPKPKSECNTTPEAVMVYSGGAPCDTAIHTIEGGYPHSITAIRIKGNSIN